MNNQTKVSAAIENGFTFAAIINKEFLAFKSQSALSRVVNKAKKLYGIDKYGEPKQCGAYGVLNFTNAPFYF